MNGTGRSRCRRRNRIPCTNYVWSIDGPGSNITRYLREDGDFVGYCWDDSSVEGDEDIGSAKVGYTDSFMPVRRQMEGINTGATMGSVVAGDRCYEIIMPGSYLPWGRTQFKTEKLL